MRPDPKVKVSGENTPVDFTGLCYRVKLWQGVGMRYVITALFLAGPVHAETPMNGDQFEALMTGKTLTFSADGQPYGMEYYAPNRRVIWSFIGGECVTGEWYQDERAICFVYEYDPDEPKCWEVFEDNGQIRAVFMNRPGMSVLYEMSEAEPLICGGVGA